MSKDEEVRNANVRRRNLVYLMQRFLQDVGYFKTAATLQTEARLSDEYELCDNIDLDAVYLEYASYYHLKFGKYPKILRKTKPPLKVDVALKRNKPRTSPSAATLPPPPVEPVAELAPLEVTVTKIETEKQAGSPIACTITSPSNTNTNNGGLQRNDALIRLQEIEHGGIAGGSDQLLGNCGEWQALAELVRSTILQDEPKLSFADICGNANAIEVLKEAVLAPLKYPQLFAANGLQPWRSMLLHGPPGSGKTLLAKVLYAETRSQVTFFNVTASVVISKWRGESEKIVKILFHLARKHAPSVIFLDEIEGLTSRRDRPSDHESSKRFKNELLQLLDGMEQHEANVFVLASTNLPWDIDDAFLRRFEKKLLVQLPNATERAQLIGKLLPLSVAVTQATMEHLIAMSECFTGDEIRLACKEIAMQAVRRVVRQSGGGGGGKEGKPPAAAAGAALEKAFEQIKPLSVKLMCKHVQWQKEHGS